MIGTLSDHAHTCAQVLWSKPALARAALEGFRFGQLRHTGATLALEAGANPVLVAFRLGHTSTRMLEQHYAGRLDRADRELARALDDAAQMRHAGGAGSSASGHSVALTCGFVSSPNGIRTTSFDLRKRTSGPVGISGQPR